MATLQDRLLPNLDEVTAKVIDGEAIIINLLTGVYYSLEGVGAVLWQAVEKGARIGDAADALAGRFGDRRSEIERDLVALADRLVAEKIALVHDTGEACGFTPDALPQAYATPELVAYQDMAEILALDPPTPGVFDSLLKDPDPSSGDR